MEKNARGKGREGSSGGNERQRQEMESWRNVRKCGRTSAGGMERGRNSTVVGNGDWRGKGVEGYIVCEGREGEREIKNKGEQE